MSLNKKDIVGNNNTSQFFSKHSDNNFNKNLNKNFKKLIIDLENTIENLIILQKIIIEYKLQWITTIQFYLKIFLNFIKNKNFTKDSILLYFENLEELTQFYFLKDSLQKKINDMKNVTKNVTKSLSKNVDNVLSSIWKDLQENYTKIVNNLNENGSNFTTNETFYISKFRNQLFKNANFRLIDSLLFLENKNLPKIEFINFFTKLNNDQIKTDKSLQNSSQKLTQKKSEENIENIFINFLQNFVTKNESQTFKTLQNEKIKYFEENKLNFEKNLIFILNLLNFSKIILPPSILNNYDIYICKMSILQRKLILFTKISSHNLFFNIFTNLENCNDHKIFTKNLKNLFSLYKKSKEILKTEKKMENLFLQNLQIWNKKFKNSKIENLQNINLENFDLIGTEEVENLPFLEKFVTNLTNLDNDTNFYQYFKNCNKKAQNNLNKIILKFTKIIKNQTNEKLKFCKVSQIKNYKTKLFLYLLQSPTCTFLENDENLNEKEIGICFFEMDKKCLQERKEKVYNFCKIYLNHIFFSDQKNLQNNFCDFSNNQLQSLFEKYLKEQLSLQDLQNITKIVNYFEENFITKNVTENFFPNSVIDLLKIKNPKIELSQKINKLLQNNDLKNLQQEFSQKKENNRNEKLIFLRKRILLFLQKLKITDSIFGSLFDFDENFYKKDYNNFFTKNLTNLDKEMFKLLAYDYQRIKLCNFLITKNLNLLNFDFVTQMVLSEKIENFVNMTPTKKLESYLNSYYRTHYTIIENNVYNKIYKKDYNENGMTIEEIKLYEKLILEIVPTKLLSLQKTLQKKPLKFTKDQKITIFQQFLQNSKVNQKNIQKLIIFPILKMLKQLYHLNIFNSKIEISKYWYLFSPKYLQFILKKP
ncbi:hypothetical protein ABK040_016219 [Willaertia magna]